MNKKTEDMLYEVTKHLTTNSNESRASKNIALGIVAGMSLIANAIDGYTEVQREMIKMQKLWLKN